MTSKRFLPLDGGCICGAIRYRQGPWRMARMVPSVQAVASSNQHAHRPGNAG